MRSPPRAGRTCARRRLDDLGVLAFGERRRPDQVGEQRRRELPLLAAGAFGLERRGARVAELRAVGVLGAARGADGHRGNSTRCPHRSERLRSPSAAAAPRGATPRRPCPPTGRSRPRAASCGGRSASGTLRRLTRIRYQVVRAAAHRVDQDVGRLQAPRPRRDGAPSSARAPRSASALVAARAISIERRRRSAGRPVGPVVLPGRGRRHDRPPFVRRAAPRACDGWTRGGSPSCFA